MTFTNIAPLSLSHARIDIRSHWISSIRDWEYEIRSSSVINALSLFPRFSYIRIYIYFFYLRVE